MQAVRCDETLSDVRDQVLGSLDIEREQAFHRWLLFEKGRYDLLPKEEIRLDEIVSPDADKSAREWLREKMSGGGRGSQPENSCRHYPNSYLGKF